MLNSLFASAGVYVLWFFTSQELICLVAWIRGTHHFQVLLSIGFIRIPTQPFAFRQRDGSCHLPAVSSTALFYAFRDHHITFRLSGLHDHFFIDHRTYLVAFKRYQTKSDRFRRCPLDWATRWIDWNPQSSDQASVSQLSVWQISLVTDQLADEKFQELAQIRTRLCCIHRVSDPCLVAKVKRFQPGKRFGQILKYPWQLGFDDECFPTEKGQHPIVQKSGNSWFLSENQCMDSLKYIPKHKV